MHRVTLRDAKAARMSGNHCVLARHYLVINLGAGAVEFFAPLAGRIAKRHHRQRNSFIPVNGQRAGDGDKRQPQRLCRQPSGWLHLIDNHPFDAKLRQRRRQRVAEHIGGARQILDQPNDARPCGMGHQA